MTIEVQAIYMKDGIVLQTPTSTITVITARLGEAGVERIAYDDVFAAAFVFVKGVPRVCIVPAANIKCLDYKGDVKALSIKLQKSGYSKE